MEPANAALITRFENGATLMAEAVRGTPENELDKAPAPGKWSIRQIVVHVTDADVVAAMRFRLIAAQPGSRLTPFDQEIWAERLDYSQQPMQDALDAFLAVRRYTAAMLRALPPAAWKNTAVHEERGEVGLPGYLEHMCVHAENHAGQIRNARKRFQSPA